ncbi:trigger factor [Magnetovibrio blakemorei]|uniref:Trigger factor n=1 Tax=Magnetovibrio blakemorei TaxID=28181 RepID=A0A1E5Q987_9PROT|nr:trigger factor [Magnetovibrio blakemorei]OEJ68053.1 trigger factor [Magnetovibrio blakemorei]
MQVTETKNEGLSREFTIVVPANEFEEQVSSRLNELSKTVQLPGFRKGKVPVSLLRKKYGPNIMGEALDKTVQETSAKVMSDNELRPALQPKIEIVSFDEGKDLEYTLAVDVMPVIELGDFSKISVERVNAETDETEVVKTLERMAEGYKTSTPVAKARKSKAGDVLNIDFLGKVDGEAFPGGKAEGYDLELGSGSFIPGFEDQLIGQNVGATLDVKVKFPDEYGAENLAGKDAVFEVKINEMKESAPSAIDDELAKKAGMENLDALKAAIRDQHSQGFTQISKQKTKRVLLDALHDAYSFDLPAGLVEAEYESIQKAFEQAKEAGQDVEDMSDEERETDFRSIAVRRVKLGLLFAEIGRVNNIQITQDDLQKAILQEAQNYPGQEQMVFKYYQEHPEAMQQLSGPVFEEKVTDFILELAKVTDKIVSIEELLADDDEPAKPAKKAAAKKPAAKKAAAKDADDKPAAKKPAAKKAPAKKAAAKKAD